MAPVLRLLVEQPVAVRHIAGEDVALVESLGDAGAVVVRQLHYLTAELDPLVQTHGE